MIKKLLALLQSKDATGKKPNKLGYVVIIGLVGILLMIMSNIFISTPKSKEMAQSSNRQTNQAEEKGNALPASATSNVDELESSYEKDLTAMLENIRGVSDVEVMINLDSTNIKIYEKDLITGKQVTDEKDKNGGNRQIEDNTEETHVVFVRQGDQEAPLLIQTKKPNVRGVFVVAKGVERATVKKWVVEAISRVLDVPTHRVSVMPRK
ncbi:stage III sporulation protein AG [Virgibacillus sp. 179-BFC.A HS]|uniref:Stage III sporulation protein AG n=1 Tax=Tigheibacillus jepli TaxID=3035914 RepID=A0ABU5CJD3_9BACI|nr:stage III sporulation protein AG [Virgibacillus sp. 179-BFC.A HS]MDY0405610.1 stage III sporulation protein AG [Virgibacillus sp. 179-BFC.A HS]